MTRDETNLDPCERQARRELRGQCARCGGPDPTEWCCEYRPIDAALSIVRPRRGEGR
jgi:hypothetical protein